MRWPWQKSERTGLRAIATRGFAAAETNRLISAWRWDGGFNAVDISQTLATIRARSRTMQKDSPHYNRWLKMVATNIVGTGFSFKSAPHDGPYTSRNLDKSAARFIEYHYWQWCNTPEYYDFSGVRTAAKTDRLCCRTWARDGEYFKIMEPASNPYGISVRLIRPDALDETYNVERNERGNTVSCGVELDYNTHRPVAYYFHTIPLYATAFNTARGWPLFRFPADKVIHGFTQEDEDQMRGIPWGHAALVKLWMLDEYDKAEITAARDEACSVATYYAPPGEEGKIADLADPANKDTANALIQEKGAGQEIVLPQGWKREVHVPQHPNREAAAFKATILRDVASGLGVEYANFANDWSGVSFSSVRAGTISERDHWMVLQDDMIAMDKSREFKMWLKSFLSYAISGDFPIAKFDKFSEHEFRGRRWMWVDPMRDMAAAVVAKQNGWKTDTQITADMGGDFDDNVEEIKREAVTKKGTPLEAGLDPVATRALVSAAIAKEIEDEK